MHFTVRLPTGIFWIALCAAVDWQGVESVIAKVTGTVTCRKSMAFGWGDAVDERWRCSVDPAGKPINPTAMRLLSSTISNAGRFIRIRSRSDDAPTNTTGPTRSGRRLDPLSDADSLTSRLLHLTKVHNHDGPLPTATGRDDTCSAPPARLLPAACCEVRTEVAYPQFGQSAITEETFTIIQDFPDFVQPVFKRVCVHSQCNVIYGNCTQKYVPHAVFSAPSGKFGSLFGQDYLLVESGCECVPFNPIPASAAPSAISTENTPLPSAPTAVDVGAVNDRRNSVVS